MNSKVKAFMEKHGHDINVTLPCSYQHHLHTTSKVLKDWSRLMEKQLPNNDPRIMCAHLMCEELGEVLEAMWKGDELLLLDGLADLLYVVFGVAVTFGLPIEKAFDEIHQSNMTKEVHPNDPRCRIKGDSYIAPNLQRILDENY